jgi:hypothetical protein
MTDDGTEVLRVPDGRTLTIRPAISDDVDGLLKMYASLSPEDRYRRFFSGSRPARRVIERLVDAPAKGGEWLVAMDDDGTIVADVGYTALPNGDAELAITVTKPWRGWLGPYLLDLAARRANAKGIANLRADILLENRKMLTLAARRGCATVDHPDRNVIELTMSTGEGMPGWPPAHERHRLLVEGCGGRWRNESAARAAGWDVIACAGPGSRWVPGCPMLTGGRCPLVDDADVVVMAFPPGDRRRADLLEAHARLAPDVRVVMDEDVDGTGQLGD